MSATFFSNEGARRVIDQTVRGERSTNPATGSGRGAQTGPVWAFVKITGAGGSAAGWPGKVLLPITTNDLADQTADATIFSAVPGEAPGGQGPYIARLSGWDDTNSRSTWQALFHDVCCGTTITPGGCNVVPPPKCAACLFIELVDGYGTPYSGYLRGDVATPQGTCGYGGQIGTVSVSITINASGITTHLSQSVGASDFVDVHYFACSSWDGESCLNIGGIQDIQGQIGAVPHIVSACPATCPGGGGVVFDGGGGITGGGAGFPPPCQPCDPAVDSPCYKCGDGRFCANAEACFGGTGPKPATKSAGGCGCGGGASSGGCSCSGGGSVELVNNQGTGILNLAEGLATEIVADAIAALVTPLTGYSAPAALSADVNNYAAVAALVEVRTDNLGPRNITGFDASGVNAGDRMVVRNVGGTDAITISHNSGSSSAANRVVSISGTGITLAAGGALGSTKEIQHNGTAWYELP